jgi:tetratricopeptide (TPR) repeat protein
MSSISIVSDLASGRDALLAGDSHAAVAILERIVAAAPADIEPRYWLASAKLTARDPQAAAAMDDARILHALAQARAMGADVHRCRIDSAYAAEIATRLYAQKLVAMSGVVRGMALSTAIDAQGLLNYGLALQHQGRAEEACQVFRAAAENFPSAAAHQFLIYP